MITITRENLHAALRAVLPFASQDETRMRLNGIRLEVTSGHLYLIATDGHTLANAQPQCKAQSDGWGFLTVAQAKGLALAIKPRAAERHLEVVITLGPESIAVEGISHGYPRTEEKDQFPPWRQVTPDRANAKDDAVAVFSLDPRYLERAGRAARDFCPSIIGYRISVPAESLDPVRLDLSHPERGDLVIVIMPRRDEEEGL